ncbi:VOC family protein [uncultured Tateyamaria sp.]|uniref:VOC family protein n=1 Tax=uncultured Tateyamaria sp. TaxID=455651 RepID=UPI00261F25C7|nr:VOC family protein [uncultured Tateyamaria sp.]
MAISPDVAPNRILFAMLRVTDLERSVAFYRDMLGMTEFERETFAEANFTVVYMGYGNKDQGAILELTYNEGNDGYEHGTAFGNISLEVDDVFAVEAFLKEHDVTILRPAGKLAMTSKELGREYTLAHIADPDGYRIELMQTLKA